MSDNETDPDRSPRIVEKSADVGGDTIDRMLDDLSRRRPEPALPRTRETAGHRKAAYDTEALPAPVTRANVEQQAVVLSSAIEEDRQAAAVKDDRNGAVGEAERELGVDVVLTPSTPLVVARGRSPSTADASDTSDARGALEGEEEEVTPDLPPARARSRARSDVGAETVILPRVSESARRRRLQWMVVGAIGALGVFALVVLARPGAPSGSGAPATEPPAAPTAQTAHTSPTAARPAQTASPRLDTPAVGAPATAPAPPPAATTTAASRPPRGGSHAAPRSTGASAPSAPPPPPPTKDDVKRTL